MHSVWYAIKPGEPRRYAMADAPLPETRAALAREGFVLYRVDFELPDDARAVGGEPEAVH